MSDYEGFLAKDELDSVTISAAFNPCQQDFHKLVESGDLEACFGGENE